MLKTKIIEFIILYSTYFTASDRGNIHVKIHTTAPDHDNPRAVSGRARPSTRVKLKMQETSGGAAGVASGGCCSGGRGTGRRGGAVTGGAVRRIARV